MKQQRVLSILAFAALLLSIFAPAGCTSESDVLYPIIEPDSTLVSFSEKIIPVFNDACNFNGCHNTGGVAPDLTPENAYSALFEGGFIDTLAPEESVLYLWISGQESIPMPPPPAGLNQQLNQDVLSWIAQGAKDN